MSKSNVKGFCVLMVIFLWILVFQMTTSAFGYYYYQNFNNLLTNATPADWTVTSGSATVQNNPSSTNKSLLMSSSTNAYTDFGAHTGFITIEYKFMQTTKAASQRVTIFDSNGTASGDRVAYMSTGSTDLLINNSLLVSNYSANTWYKIKIVADNTGKSIDVYVNDTQIINNMPYSSSSATDVGRITLSTDSSGSYYIDDVKAYNDTSEPKVNYVDNGSTVTLKNQVAALTFQKSNAGITSITRDGGQNLVGNGGSGYFQYSGTDNSDVYGVSNFSGSVYYQSDEVIDYVCAGGTNSGIPFKTDIHFVMTSNSEGYYMYTKLVGNTTATLGQVNYDLRVDPNLFKQYVVEDNNQGTFPTPADIVYSETQRDKYSEGSANYLYWYPDDSTYRLSNGSFYTKYMQSKVFGQNTAFGIYGGSYGISFIKPENEDFVGGPSKQDLTVHQTDSTPIMLWYMNSSHYGNTSFQITSGWTKVYGPVMYYVRPGSSSSTMWSEAKSALKSEINKWPYYWVKESAYNYNNRGNVKGTIAVSGNYDTVSNLTVVLQPDTYNATDWKQDGMGYLYSTKVTGSSNTFGFSITGVRPGTYTLYAYGTGVTGQYLKKSAVTITANTTVSTGTLTWTPVKHGTRLWQVGTPDGTGLEFKHGDAYHVYGIWNMYPTDFPNDVNFTVGGNISTGINLIQPKYKDPNNTADGTLTNWKIHFTPTSAYSSGKLAWLTFGIAASQGGGLDVKLVNSKGTTQVYTAASFGITDSAIPRLGAFGVYKEVTFSFDATKLVANQDNYLQIAVGSGATNRETGQMYDFIRMEVQ